MTNLVKALREEAAQITRREIRANAASSRQVSARYRREVTELTKRLATLEREVRSMKRAGKLGGRPVTPGPVGNFRFSPASVRAKRKKLGLPAADYAALLGVHAMTVYNWEHGRSKPRRSQMAALAALSKLSKKEVLKRLGG